MVVCHCRKGGGRCLGDCALPSSSSSSSNNNNNSTISQRTRGLRDSDLLPFLGLYDGLASVSASGSTADTNIWTVARTTGGSMGPAGRRRQEGMACPLLSSPSAALSSEEEEEADLNSRPRKIQKNNNYKSANSSTVATLPLTEQTYASSSKPGAGATTPLRQSQEARGGLVFDATTRTTKTAACTDWYDDDHDVPPSP
jgi:hypothetical protein